MLFNNVVKSDFMKILHVISSFPPAYAYGGALKSAYEISKQLVKDGHDVTVYTTDANSKDSRLEFKENPILMDGIKVYYFRNISNRLSYKNFPISPDMAVALKKNINKFDIVHVHEYRSFQAMLVHHYSKKNRVPYIVQPHGSAVNIMGMFWFKKMFDKMWGNSLLKDSSKVIALTNREKDSLKSLGINESNIQIIPNGINLLDYKNLPEKGIFRKKYGIQPDEKIILFLGRLHKIKGIDLLIGAFSDLSKDRDDIKLVIVGPDGGFLPDIMKLIKKSKIENKVVMPGPLYGKNKLEAFVDANIYVLPSIYETFPNTIIESCVCGTPVVMTDNCGISDVIKNNNVGFVSKCEKNSLKQSILKLLTNDKIKENLNSPFILNYFNLNTVVKNLEKCYNELNFNKTQW